MKRLRNLGYSLLATALRTEAGAQPPGFTVAKQIGIIIVCVTKLLVIKCTDSVDFLRSWAPSSERTECLFIQKNFNDLARTF